TLASDTFFQAYLLDGLARWNEDRSVAATTDEQQHSYNHLLRHAVNSLAEDVLGEKIIPYVGPRKYTGELIGVEYLYAQTGKALQDYKLAIEESETTDLAIEVDERHFEPEEFQDITVPTFETERTPAASSQSSASVVRPSPDSVGPDNIEGYGAVQDLAEFLFGLRDHRLALTGEECAQIITLWQALGEYDKKRTVYPPRHQTSLKQGRFRATKKIVAPGVESTKRCFVGAHSPAQWPDCNRVVEAIFIRLCALYPGAVRCDGRRVSRFTVVTRAYNHIKECIVSNAKVMSETTIQLPEVNAATLTQ
ncbi:unnamed protein product, partial [Merluccius merluccius]